MRDLCRKCFKTTHNRGFCTGVPVVACTDCLRMNSFTTSCVCKGKMESCQSFRLCGKIIPRAYVDVTILTTIYPALVDPELLHTKIDNSIAKSVEILIGVSRSIQGTLKVTINNTDIVCNIEDRSSQAPVVLGMDFLSKQQFKVSCDKVNSPVFDRYPTTHPDEVNFAYNLPEGQLLKRNLELLGYDCNSPYSRRHFEDIPNQRRTYFSLFRDNRY